MMSRRGDIRFEYDRDVDAAYLTLARGKVVESDEVSPGVVLDRGARGQILGIEILRFAKRFLPQARPRSASAPNAAGRSLRKSA